MEKLKDLRKENKKTLQDMAKYLGISHPAYFKYETGENKPTIETLIKLADYYGVSLDYLVGRKFQNDVGYLNEQQRAIIDIMKQLNEYNQVKLLAEAQGMLIAQN